MPLKILHTSDIHVGMKFASYDGEVQEKLVEARFECLSRLVATANEHSCELLVVAGDLFDRVTVAKRDILRAASASGEFEGAATVILPGNHDYTSPDKSDLWHTFKEAAQGNVLVCDQPSPYPLAKFDVDATVYPGPCTSKHSPENAIGWIAEVERAADVKHHIGLAHGSLEGVSPDFDGRYYPMTTGELEALGLDIWLLGHTHLPYPQSPSPGDRIFLAGTPEPDGFNCTHSGSAWVHEMGDEAVQSQLITVGQYRFEHETKSISTEKDLQKVEASYAVADSKNLLLKMILTGRLPPDSYERLGQLEAAIAKSVFELRWDDSAVTRQITVSDIDATYTEGSFPHCLLRTLAQSDDDFEALQKAHEIVEELRR
jgi:DNA repair exonuclease SbcCD nuclease subunit